MSVASALSIAAVPAACGSGCRDTSLEALPATFQDGGEIVFTARLTAGGDPVEGQTVAFFSLTRGSQGSGGHEIGDAETDADGIATLVREQGLEGMAVVDQEVVGYQVRFANLGDLSYCTSEDDGEIDGL